MRQIHCELIKASRYYKNKAPGWVALINGQPHHVKSKAEAQEFINRFQNTSSTASGSTYTSTANQTGGNTYDPDNTDNQTNDI